MIENFTFDDGIEPGGLRSRNEIKLLVCYLLSGVDEKITRSQLCEIALDKGLANYFEVNQAVSDLIETVRLYRILSSVKSIWVLPKKVAHPQKCLRVSFHAPCVKRQ